LLFGDPRAFFSPHDGVAVRSTAQRVLGVLSNELALSWATSQQKGRRDGRYGRSEAAKVVFKKQGALFGERERKETGKWELSRCYGVG
jgi:hypothetical protein